MGKHDIQSFEDCHRLVERFYEHLLNSEIAYIFIEVAKIDLIPHVEVVAKFWAQLLLGLPGYSGNPMQPHLILAQKTPLGDQEFSIWLKLFNQSVDELYSGPIAEQAKTRAMHIASVMKFKLQKADK